MELSFEGMRELEVNLKRTTDKVGEASMKGLQAVGLEIIAEAKLNLKRNRTTNTGALSASGKVQKDDTGVDAGFFSQNSSEGYAAVVEYGRGPTKTTVPGPIPVRDVIKAWAHRKLGIPYGKDLDKAAYFIARKIHRRGTRPQPFLGPAVEKIQQKFDDIMSRYINDATK